MYSKKIKRSIIKKIENNRDLFEMKGEYENHKPVLCMFTDNYVVHVYHKDAKEYPIGWAVNVKLSNGEMISCIATHYTYDRDDIDDNDDFVIE
jgi:hypothetical protein